MKDATAILPHIVNNADAFVALLEQHAGIVHKVAAAYSIGVADRHDLMQEIRLQLWKAYPRYAPDRPFSTWMYRIALNVAISFLRRTTHPVRQTVPLHELTDESVPPIDDTAKNDPRIPLLQQVIASLPPLDRAILLLYLDDQSYRDIGGVLGITETNVATKISRLKQTLRRKMTA